MFKQRKNLTSISYGMNSSFRLHRPSIVTLTCPFELVKGKYQLVTSDDTGFAILSHMIKILISLLTKNINILTDKKYLRDIVITNTPLNRNLLIMHKLKHKRLFQKLTLGSWFTVCKKTFSPQQISNYWYQNSELSATFHRQPNQTQLPK